MLTRNEFGTFEDSVAIIARRRIENARRQRLVLQDRIAKVVPLFHSKADAVAEKQRLESRIAQLRREEINAIDLIRYPLQRPSRFGALRPAGSLVFGRVVSRPGRPRAMTAKSLSGERFSFAT